ncbi:MAG TPA: 4-alpha-glucanotransferase [Acetobacteraceae bacterium]|nr:4-alpha-glucanotransferase [Acetobacteraceae bacterium]
MRHADAALVALADAAGVAARWRDVQGKQHDVAPPTLRAVLRAIGFPADTDRDIADSHARLRDSEAALPPLLVVDAGQAIALRQPWRLTLESGETQSGEGPLRLSEPGYHRLEIGGHAHDLAVAPSRCHPAPRAWGIAAQLYGLRREGDGGIGDFAALADLARAAARRGAAAIAVSPVHAQFSADPHRFSPYAPSSRIMLNVLHANAPHGEPALEAAELVDWPNAARARLAQFRALFAAGADRDELTRFRAESGATLEAHARFEALHAHFYGRDPALWHWHHWPDDVRTPDSEAVAAFARKHAEEVAFHAWLQFRADRDLAAAQAAARGSGMAIGLIADLAVGTDAGGSHAWSRQDEMLPGLSVGAPPDLLNTRGQDWGLATFSPHGLRRHGYAAFIELLRSALRHAGGMRIDHAMGLQRLWAIPEGAAPVEGTYLRYPFADLLRLVRLESRRHGAVILAEDLGTVPDGFSGQLAEAGVLGMRVLWFEREKDGRFRPPASWTRNAAAMTSTHDLPTVAGWWHGRDIDWRERIGLVHDRDAAEAERAQDRAALWQAFRDSGAAPAGSDPTPEAAATAACAHVARTAATLALLPLEDLLALEEQPNLPGTLDEHPNWRRRYDGPAAALLDAPAVAARIAAVAASR